MAGGYVYWRYELSGLSGIASGFPGSSQVDVLVSPFNEITRFDVDAHVVFQHASGVLQAIQAGNGFAVTLGNAPTCAAVASDFANVYCRANGASTSTLYSWPITGAATPTVVHVLPLGRDLAVDDQQFYFSDDKGGFTNQAIVESAPRAGDGGTPTITQLVVDQTSPHDLTVEHLVSLLDRRPRQRDHLRALRLQAHAVRRAAERHGLDRAFHRGRALLERLLGRDRRAGLRWRHDPARSAARRRRLPSARGITGLSGLAVDSGYVYWTQSDGSVYRAPTNDARL